LIRRRLRGVGSIALEEPTMDWLIPLLTLTAMEIVLGIDNIVFIAILSARLPVDQQAKARRLGLGAALVMRILLLFSLSWLLGLTTPVFHLTDLGIPAAWVERVETHPPAGATAVKTTSGHIEPAALHDVNGISWRDIILLVGGLFLIGKSVTEIHHKIEGATSEHAVPATATMGSVLLQIAILDIVFSLDSVITAVGMAKQIWVMVVAVILAVGVMLWAAGPISGFVERHPTLKILALSFLILIGVLLVAEGIGTPVNKGYIYFAMAFALGVEMLNLKLRGKGPSRIVATH
jgi:predicted tellurium resistance membrane protein TerC